MNAAELTALRRGLGLTQTEMAERMGLSMRAYQVAEAEEGEIKVRHVAAAERVALSVALERKNPMLAPAGVRREALELARLIREG